MKLEDIYKKGDISPRITNEVIHQLSDCKEINNYVHVVFSYCYLGLIGYLYYNRKYEEFNVTVRDIKEMLGYNSSYKKVDYLIKNNGVLDKLGLTVTSRSINYDKAKNSKMKIPNFLDEDRECHTFNIKLFMEFINDNDLGLSGFYIMNFINEIYDNDKMGERGTASDIANKLKTHRRMTNRYYKALFQKGYVYSNAYGNKDHLKSLNAFLRGKLFDWNKKSLEAHDNKCFISGDTDDIVVHHVESFNVIRDKILRWLNLNIKHVNEYTEDELTQMENLLMDYHNINLGVPLRRDLHVKFHREYGHNVTTDDLMQFKNKYINEYN